MMPIKCRILSYKHLDFTLQPLNFHKTDMTPWAIFPSKTGNERLIPSFWWQIVFHPSPEILTKQNIKETTSKGKIWVPFYIPTCEGSGGN